jgi:DNA invertase Pin-like site-specific DNA recombinase
MESQKVEASHLRRNAYLYVRQSTLRQVLENTESTKRQYALRQRAVALGWSSDQVIVIDCDQGHSGSQASDREGFQRLVAEVSMGRVGIVLGLEVSRLARNSADWHRLLELCAMTDTLILDEDGLYNPTSFNDRLLLGLKGTMSEAELHVLQARLRGGVLSKARRGELAGPLPVGLCYDPAGRVVLDPDTQVQEAIRHLFHTFRRTGSARATLKEFNQAKLLFPRRIRSGLHKGELAWAPLAFSRALQVLHNPRYAGAFFFGRRRFRRRPDGGYGCEMLAREEWISLIPDAHPGYISWEEFEDNQRRLAEQAQAHGADRRASPPREGPALLQGLVICGVCGLRMTVRYHLRRGVARPDYICQHQFIDRDAPRCQTIPGAGIDVAVGDLLLATLTPMALEVALTVEEELHNHAAEADRLRRQHVERARYEADLARRRYMAVDPTNRLVADALEVEWNERLRGVTTAEEDYDRQARAGEKGLSEEQLARVRALARDFPALWRDAQTPDRERKRMVRLLVEDVTLKKTADIFVGVRFKGGQTTTLRLPIPPTAAEIRRTPAEVVEEIDRLLDHHTDGEIAAILNERGLTSGERKSFHRLMVNNLRHEYGLTSRHDRLRQAGMLTIAEVAVRLGVSTSTVNHWRRQGLLEAYRYNDKGECLYADPGPNPPIKHQGRPAHRATSVRSTKGGAV